MMVHEELNPGDKLTEEQIKMLEALKDSPVEYDEENPPLTEEQLKQFKRVSPERQAYLRGEETVPIRLSPQAFEKAKAIGKDYTAVLSRILENALNDNETIRRYL
ncbi:MAG: hypothetical protein NC084_03365 [Bacteroides sp.]|nr:antitoxin [Eubacterium sp.]MCM1417553.1 antitoxin [Roseburia sp.]MCM1461736.1 hypothetical protein [Bacteroides sp.]